MWHGIPVEFVQREDEPVFHGISNGSRALLIKFQPLGDPMSCHKIKGKSHRLCQEDWVNFAQFHEGAS